MGELADLDVAHFAVEGGEAAPFFHGVLLHGEQYSGLVARGSVASHS